MNNNSTTVVQASPLRSPDALARMREKLDAMRLARQKGKKTEAGNVERGETPSASSGTAPASPPASVSGVETPKPNGNTRGTGQLYMQASPSPSPSPSPPSTPPARRTAPNLSAETRAARSADRLRKVGASLEGEPATGIYPRIPAPNFGLTKSPHQTPQTLPQGSLTPTLTNGYSGVGSPAVSSPPSGFSSSQPQIENAVVAEPESYLQPSPDEITTPLTPRGPVQILSPAEKAARTIERALKIQASLNDDPGHEAQSTGAASPIPTREPVTPKAAKTVPSPTERSPIPPTTKRTPSFPYLGKADGNHMLIGFDPQVQALMNQHELSWAVQYEVTRFRSQSQDYCFTMEEYARIFPDLRGLNDVARHVIHLLRTLVRGRRENTVRSPELQQHLDAVKRRVADLERTEKDPYVELDLEEEAIKACKGAGLGLTSHGPDPEWYGGQVEQGAVLVELSKKGGFTTNKPRSHEFTIVLQKHKMGRSNRVLRRFGSRRVLQVSVPPAVIQRNSEALREFFSNKFVLNGRVFEAVCAKDHTVYLLETGDYDSSGSGLATLDHISKHGRMSLFEFTQWHNPIDFNNTQTFSKWAARFSLAFSTSVPACRFMRPHLQEIPDIRPSEGCPDRCIMTDGCGFMNRAVALNVQRLLNLKYLPSAVQARVGGVKGMFTLHPDHAENMSEIPKLWCRPTQIKIRYGPDTFVSSEPSQLTLDLLRCPHPKMPAHLSKEVITCLAHGGVQPDALEQIFLAALKEQFEQLATWEGPDALVKLWRAVFDVEHVLQGRLRRVTSGASRAWGFGEAATNIEAELSLDSDDDDDMSDRSVTSSPDALSGLPSSLVEQILSFLQAGFHPESTPILKKKLEILIKKAICDFVEKYHVSVPFSVEGFAIPDPMGVLEEGEVYFRGSTQWQGSDGLWVDTLVGDVLATRHPCKVSSDVQKFRAVDRSELREWADVIIFSTKGARSPLSLLGGGDYDGDTVIIIWDPAIVNSFTNAPLDSNGLCAGDPPEDFLAKNFDKSVVRISDYMESMPANEGEAAKDCQKWLLAPLVNESVVGQYSVLHEKAALFFGYDDPRTIRLAQCFCNCLDGIKGGISIKKDVKKEDSAMFDKYQLPKSRGGEPGYTTSSWATPRKTAARDESLGTDIIERLWRAGQEARKGYEDILNRRRDRFYDDGLCRPYQEVVQRAMALKNPAASEAILGDIRQIKEAVHHARKEYDERINSKRLVFWKLPALERLDLLKAVSAELQASLDMIEPDILSRNDILRVAASYAYVSDMESYNQTHVSYMDKGTTFPFDVMFRELADINARNTGKSVTIINQFAECFVVHPSFLKVP